MVFSKELLDLILELLKSWQVIGVTVVLIFYFALVLYVARLYRRPRAGGFSAPRKAKKAKPKPAPAAEISVEDDDLGLDDE
ncbi:hypothetical protein [Breznakiella homolactica]|uniref:Uncharacterized protein n=1 Tax=Breznakiella homolactica TaxID=2798577 RepID=A0A7T7XQX6_9SPIR|nr:hypothetical protein [Breznakiella homolactica]QQO10792.1 hypothetical protein JFL75_07705 [Breznakiella homolactica]